MSNYPYIPTSITPPWLYEEDAGIENYNNRPYLINLNNKTFELIVDTQSRGHIYLDNYSGDDADVTTCVYDQITTACEANQIALDGFDGKTFTAVIQGDDEDRAAAVELVKEELLSNGGIDMVEV